MSQQTDALERANKARQGIKQVRAELRCGVITVDRALADPRADSMQVVTLLMAKPWLGVKRTQTILNMLNISPARRVRDLTDQQKFAIAEAVER